MLQSPLPAEDVHLKRTSHQAWRAWRQGGMAGMTDRASSCVMLCHAMPCHAMYPYSEREAWKDGSKTPRAPSPYTNSTSYHILAITIASSSTYLMIARLGSLRFWEPHAHPSSPISISSSLHKRDWGLTTHPSSSQSLPASRPCTLDYVHTYLPT